MAEKEPGAILGTAEVPKVETPEISSLRQTIETMQAELEKAQKELALAEHLRDQETAFGKHDVTAPNEGEDSYRSYLDQRPASAADDTELAGQDYYDQKYDLVNKGEHEPVDYEDMGVMQLAKEAVRVRQLNDVAGEKEVREALAHHLTMDAMKDDSETSDQAQKRYNEELARFDSLVARFESRGNPQPPHAGEAHAKPNGEGEPSARTETKDQDDQADKTDTSADSKVVIDTVAAPGAKPAPGKEMVLRADIDKVNDKVEAAVTPPPTFGGYFKDMPVSVADVTPHPTDSSKDMLTVVGEDGRVRRIPAADFTSQPVVAKADTAPAALQPEKTPGNGFTVSALGLEGDNRQPGKELVPFQGEAGADLQDTKVANQEPQSRLGKIKAFLSGELSKVKNSESVTKVTAWLGGERSKMQEYGGKAYWAAKWERAQQGLNAGKERMLNWRVKETMSEDEKERTRKQNRWAYIGGAAALTVVGIGAAMGINELMDHTQAVPDANGAIGFQPDAEPSPSAAPEVPTEPHKVEDLPIVGDPSMEDVQIPDINPEAFNIQEGSGMGGEALLKSLDIEPSQWYTVEEHLLDQFPQNFYRTDDGHVGIYAGQLPQGAQDIISSLKR